MKFLMDYDNIPGKGPLMLFKDNGDGTLSLATVEDIKLVRNEQIKKDAEIARIGIAWDSELSNLISKSILAQLDIEPLNAEKKPR